MTFTGNGFPIHIDGEVHPRPGEWTPVQHNAAAEPEMVVGVEIRPHALELWLPRGG